MDGNTVPEPTDAETHTSRRTALQLAGGALAAALAGCSGGISGGGTGGASVGEKPEYSKWIADSDLPDSPTGGETYGFIRTDFETLNESQSGEGTPAPESTATGTPQLGDSIPEPGDDMVLAPISGSVGFLLAASFGLLGYGNAASGVVTSATGGSATGGTDAETETESPHTTTAGMLSGDSIVFEGSFDTEAITDGIENFEQAGEQGEFTVYEGIERENALFETGDLAFAVSSEAVVFALPPTDSDSGSGFGTTETETPTPTPETATATRSGRDIVDDRLAVVAGDAAEAVDANDDFGWVLRAGGNGAFVTAGYGRDRIAPNSGTETAESTETGEEPAGETESQFDVEAIAEQVDAATMFANATTVDREAEEVSAEFGFVYESESDAPTEAELDAFVESASDSDVIHDGRRVSVEATWSDTNA